jgi:hypothetical protein
MSLTLIERIPPENSRFGLPLTLIERILTLIDRILHPG